MRVSEIAVRRPVTTLMFISALMLLGYISWQHLPVQLFPNLVLPQMGVYAAFNPVSMSGTMTPNEVEEKLTVPIENIIASFPRVKRISSSTFEGGCWTWVEMDFRTDMRFVFIELQERLELLRKQFPRDSVYFFVRRIDTSEFQREFMSLVIKTEGERTSLPASMLDNIRQRLEDISGVSRVRIGGFSPERVRVLVDEHRLKEHRVSFPTIIQQVQSWSSPEVYLGQYKTPRDIYYVRLAAQYDNLLDISRVPLGGNRQLQVGDVAEVRQGSEEEDRDWVFRFEGRESIGIGLEKEALVNPIVLSHRVRQEVEDLNQTLPEGVEITIRFDDGEFIEKVVAGVIRLALLGAGIAMVVLLLFLRRIRASLIVILSIPVSIIATFNLMYFAGFSLNIFSLIGLAFGIGMLVDNSIVVLENIMRHYHLTGNRRLAALRGTQEVARPILASTLTTVIVFVPILFISDEIRLIFKEMALSIVFPIVISLVVACTFVPMASCALLAIPIESRSRRRWWRRLLDWIPLYRIANLLPRFFRRTLKRMLRHPMQMILIVVFLVIFAWGNRHRIGEGYLNQDVFDEWFSVFVTLPKGTKTATTSRISLQVEEMLLEYDEIEDFGAWIQNDRAHIWVRLVDPSKRKRSREELQQDILERSMDLPEATVSRYPPQQEAPTEVFVPYGGGGSIEIRGNDQARLLTLSNQIIERVLTIPGVREAQSDLAQGEPELRLVIDREKAALFQVNAAQIAQSLRGLRKGGERADVKLRQNEDELDILFIMEEDQPRVLEDIRQLPVFTATGQVISLGDICRLEMGKTQGWIRRINQERRVRVHYQLMPNQDLNQIREEVKKHLAAMRIPPGYTVRADQERQQVDELRDNLRRIVMLGTLFIFMVLASLFESLGSPFVVLLALPLAIIGGVYGLIVMKNPFDVFGSMGVIVLVGIVVNNAILLLHFVTIKRREGWRRSRAVLVSCLTRFRPIWMTTLTTTLGMIPLAMRTSERSVWTPFAVVVIGGLFGSTVLTPYVIPAMYVVLENGWRRLKRRCFVVLSLRWILIFWSAQHRNETRLRLRRRLEDRFGKWRLSRQDLQSLPLEISARNLTLVYPERKETLREKVRLALGFFKTEILLPRPQLGIIPTSGTWQRDLTEAETDPRTGAFGFKALDCLNFKIEPGLFGLLGPNGAGKTTLIRILATSIPASRGRLTFGGFDVSTYRLDLSKIIGYLPQTFGFHDSFTPLQYLNQMAIMKGLKRWNERREAIERVLKRVNLWQERRTPIGHFSGGMRQRLGIAQTLLTAPRIIIVDEPTAGLDPRERVNFRNLLAELSRDRIVILSTHIVEDISSSCNRVGVLDKGRLIFLGTVDELLQRARGKVWEGVYTPDDAEQVLKHSTIISQTVVSSGKRLRLLSDTPPPAPAKSVEPSLEDAYIYIRKRSARGEVKEEGFE